MKKLKSIERLKKLFETEGWDRIAIWANGSWVNVGSGYGGEQDGDNPKLYLSRRSFYNTTERERRLMIRAITMALNEDGLPITMAYNIIRMGGREKRER